MKTAERVNVAPSSTEGHFIKGAKQVVNLDKVNETFLVEGPSVLETNALCLSTMAVPNGLRHKPCRPVQCEQNTSHECDSKDAGDRNRK